MIALMWLLFLWFNFGASGETVACLLRWQLLHWCFRYIHIQSFVTQFFFFANKKYASRLVMIMGIDSKCKYALLWLFASRNEQNLLLSLNWVKIKKKKKEKTTSENCDASAFHTFREYGRYTAYSRLLMLPVCPPACLPISIHSRIYILRESEWADGSAEGAK